MNDNASILDATVSGSNSNSYVSMAFVSAYFADTLDAAEWVQWSMERRAGVLVRATSVIDTGRYISERPYVDGQALTFPRKCDVDGYDDPDVPDAVAYATCELALDLLRGADVKRIDDAPRRFRKLLKCYMVNEIPE